MAELKAQAEIFELCAQPNAKHDASNGELTRTLNSASVC
jgi:hypothetical protein